jgi:cytochrome c oxidase subunit 2
MHVSVFNPESPEASSLLWLWDACMYICGFILAVVTLSIVYIMIRYRGRGNAEPDQTTGNTKLEIIWTAVPICLVALLFGLSVVTARAVDHPVHRSPDIIVTGHQWWWEVTYPAAHAITANEIHLPVGEDMLLGIETADVIHDFWAPRLGRKIDAIPGRRNLIWIRASAPGEYDGACAEYCGAQHAWMRFRVVAQEPTSYQTWLTHQAQPAQMPTDPQALQGKTLFSDRTCASCHNIAGLNKQNQYAPDLTHVATRRMLAAERLRNSPENLAHWLREPNIIKPNSYMPNLKLSQEEVASLTAFLETLK